MCENQQAVPHIAAASERGERAASPDVTADELLEHLDASNGGPVMVAYGGLPVVAAEVSVQDIARTYRLRDPLLKLLSERGRQRCCQFCGAEVESFDEHSCVALPAVYDLRRVALMHVDHRDGRPGQCGKHVQAWESRPKPPKKRRRTRRGN